MNMKILDAMIADGYKAERLLEFEKCNHHFQIVITLNIRDNESVFETRALCVKCKLDEHGARLMGLNPENYCNCNMEDLV